MLILGAGLSGLSASFHLGHEKCKIIERKITSFGHVKSEQNDGFTWDQGPHVSFTKSSYVKKLFEEAVDGLYEEIDVKIGNYYQGSWIAHPAQTSLYQMPKDVGEECLKSFLETRNDNIDILQAENYQQWLDIAFGPYFANNFSGIYTKKYWTREPVDLDVNWIGSRVHFPSVDDVKLGAIGPLNKSNNYINKVRYPIDGGYQSYAKNLSVGANIQFGAEVSQIDLREKSVYLSSGELHSYSRLINTLPLPVFVNLCKDVPERVRQSVRKLCCTQLLMINIGVPHESQRPEHWIYVYDEEKLSTRINFTEKLSRRNAPEGWTGIQVEVYFSKYKPLPYSPEIVAEKVYDELIEIGLVKPSLFIDQCGPIIKYQYSPWANVVFDKTTKDSLNDIWSWLENFGLARESDDLDPITNWDNAREKDNLEGSLYMAGRFGQWKYFWSDDCILRGFQLATRMHIK